MPVINVGIDKSKITCSTHYREGCHDPVQYITLNDKKWISSEKTRKFYVKPMAEMTSMVLLVPVGGAVPWENVFQISALREQG